MNERNFLNAAKTGIIGGLAVSETAAFFSAGALFFKKEVGTASSVFILSGSATFGLLYLLHTVDKRIKALEEGLHV